MVVREESPFPPFRANRIALMRVSLCEFMLGMSAFESRYGMGWPMYLINSVDIKFKYVTGIQIC